MISASSGANFHEPMTGRFSAAAPIEDPSNGGRNELGAFGWGKPMKNLRLSSRKSPRAITWRARAVRGSTGADSAIGTWRDSGSIDNMAGTSGSPQEKKVGKTSM